MQRLQELHLQHNSVEVVSEQALVGLTSLALLDLSKNNLHTLGPASLQPLVSLQVLRITGEPAAGMLLCISFLKVNLLTFLLELKSLFGVDDGGDKS